MMRCPLFRNPYLKVQSNRSVVGTGSGRMTDKQDHPISNPPRTKAGFTVLPTLDGIIGEIRVPPPQNLPGKW
jgi:hypothetical protein